MSRRSLSYILLTVFVIYTLFGGQPSLSTLKTYIVASLVPLFLIVVLRVQLVDLLLLWFACLIFKEIGQLRLPMLPDIFAHRLVWMLLFARYIIEIVMEKRESPLPLTGLDAAMLSFSLLCVFSMFTGDKVFSGTQGLTIGYFLVSFGMPFTLFFIAKNIVNDEMKIKRVFLFFILAGVYLGLTGIFEYLGLKSLVFPDYIMNPNKGIHWGRSRGPFLNAGVNGMALAIASFIAMYHYYYLYEKKKKYFTGISIVIMLSALIFTFTRAPWLGFILGAIVLCTFLPKMRKAFLLGVLILMMIIPVAIMSGMFEKNTEIVNSEEQLSEQLTSRTMSMSPIYSRIVQYAALWRMFLDKPFFGFGYGTFKDHIMEYYRPIEGIPYDRESSSHNTFAGILVEVGLVGFSLYAIILFYIARISLILYRKLPRGEYIGKELVVIFWAILIVYFIKIQTEDIRISLYPNALIFVLSGIFCGLYQRLLLLGKTDTNNSGENNLG